MRRSGVTASLEASTGMFSRDRADHPGAESAQCRITYPHDGHAYGRRHTAGGLAYWCDGSDPTGGH